MSSSAFLSIPPGMTVFSSRSVACRRGRRRSQESTGCMGVPNEYKLAEKAMPIGIFEGKA